MAQVTRAAFASSVSTKLADNTTGEVSPQDHREVAIDNIDSTVLRTTGAGAPGSTPEAVGDAYTDTTADKAYWAVDTTGSGDFKELAQVDDLAATTGAATIGIADAGAYYTGTDIEAALQEIGAAGLGGGGGAGFTQAEVEDFAGGLFTGNTETLITATYQTSDNTLDLVVDDNLANYDNSSSLFVTASTAPVTSVASKTGDVSLEAGDIGSGTFANGRIAESNVTQHQAALAVATSQLTGTVATAQLADESVTLAKQAHIATASIMGRTTAGTGDVEVLTETQARGVLNLIEPLVVAVSDEATALTTGAGKVSFRMPYAFTISEVRASVATAPTGAVLTVDINDSGATILSTKLTIDAGEKTSTTAATPAVISDTALADDAEITIDIDTVGSTIAGAGLKVMILGTRN